MSISNFKVHTSDVDICGFQSDGKGAPVLLLHGSGSSKEIFRRQFDSPLSELYRLVAIDLPGHGSSGNADHPDLTYSLAGLARTAGTVLDALGLEQAVVFGWSLGGHVAIQLAGTHPGIAGLMLTGTPPLGRGPLASLRGFHTRWDMLLASKEIFSDRDAERYLHLCFGPDGDPSLLGPIQRADGRLRKIFLRSMLRGEGVDQKSVVENTPVPVAMVNGINDPIVRRSYIEGLAYSHLWEGHCHLLPDAGHAPFWEQPEAFNRLFRRFLKDVAMSPVLADSPIAKRA